MIFLRDAITDAEQTQVVVRNLSDETIPEGGAVVWATGSGANFGADVTKPTTATRGLFAGIAEDAILANEYGAIFVWGYVPEALVIDSASQAITAGDILVPVDDQWYLTRSAASTGVSGKVHSGQDVATNVSPSEQLRKVFLG